MFDNFDITPTSRKQRLLYGTIAGLVSAIVLGIGYGAIMHYLRIPVELSIVFVGLGMLIGRAVRKFGRGVQRQIEFSVIAAVCAVICFILADAVSWYGFELFTRYLGFFPEIIGFVIQSWFDFSYSAFNSVLGLLFRLGGIYYAYINARVIVNL